MNKQKAFAVALASMVLAMAAIQESVIQAGTRFQILALPLVNTSADALPPPVDQQALFLRKAKAETVRIWGNQAREQLALEPLDAASLLTIAIASAETNEPLAARSLALAERVSRRAGVAQVEKLRLSATAGDLKGAFVHLDRLLTVNEDAVGITAGFVAQLLADPTAVSLLAQYGDRHWFPPLLAAASNQGAKPQLVADMLESSSADASALHANLIPALVRNLAHDGDIGRARAIARRYAGLQTAAVADFGISPATTDVSAGPVNWTVIRSDDGWGTVLGGQELAFRVEADSSVVVLERYTGLAAGRYLLRYNLEGEADGSALAWELTCRGNPPQAVALGTAVQPNPEAQTRQLEIGIAPGCRTQHWRLRVSASTGVGAQEMTMSKLSLISL